MMKHIFWTCDGCDKEMQEQPVPVTIAISGTMFDRDKNFELCGQCINRVSNVWPDQWPRAAEEAA